MSQHWPRVLNSDTPVNTFKTTYTSGCGVVSSSDLSHYTYMNDSLGSFPEPPVWRAVTARSWEEIADSNASDCPLPGLAAHASIGADFQQQITRLQAESREV